MSEINARKLLDYMRMLHLFDPDDLALAGPEDLMRNFYYNAILKGEFYADGD